MTTDQGSQFTSFDRTERPKRAGSEISMNGNARYLHNILTKRPWRPLKQECACLRARETGLRARAGVGHRITFCNHLRPRAAHGAQPPAVVYSDAIVPGQQSPTAD